MTDSTAPDSLIQGFLAQTKEHAIIGLDGDGVVTLWQGAAEQVFGYAPAEIVGRPCSLLFTSEDRAKGFDRHELEIARRNSRSEDDRWHVRKDGTRIWVTGSVDAIRDAAGDVVGFVKVVRDRTDLRAHIEQVENQLAASQAASERTRAFLRTLGHEMRNPLSPLQSATLIIQKTTSEPRAVKAVQILLNQIAALKRMADDLMEVSRLDTGQVELHRERTDLREVLKEVCVGFNEPARARGVNLRTLLPSGRLDVDIDPQRFMQVLLNLLSNAIKYTPRGGSVWIKATQEGDDVLVRIEDTGMGISPEMLPQLFELFTREPSAQAVAPSGLGIGLAVVREVVELHGGTVQARSGGPGKGAEFTVRLPALPG